jgi:hypothetical protein
VRRRVCAAPGDAAHTRSTLPPQEVQTTYRNTEDRKPKISPAPGVLSGARQAQVLDVVETEESEQYAGLLRGGASVKGRSGPGYLVAQVVQRRLIFATNALRSTFTGCTCRTVPLGVGVADRLLNGSWSCASGSHIRGFPVGNIKPSSEHSAAARRSLGLRAKPARFTSRRPR